MKIALVHDWLRTTMGGSERLFLRICELYPDADVYTLLFDAERYEGLIDPKRVHTSSLQKLPRALRSRAQLLLPFIPRAVEGLDLRQYDLVISSSNAFAKGVITRPDATHICYCHTPARFVWDYADQYLRERFSNPLSRFLGKRALERFRRWDKLSAARVTDWIANSHNVAVRIQRFYGKPATVIYPPVKTGVTHDFAKKDYLITVSTLARYKHVDQAIAAANKLKLPLVVVGDGPERAALEKQAGPTVQLVGYKDDAEKERLVGEAKAFLLPAEEDFGMALVEALALGTPVVAYGKGGATETVIDGVTGCLYPEPNVESLIAGIKRAETIEFDPAKIHRQAEQFDEQIFDERLQQFVEERANARAH